jgi:hypothetical protein
MVMMTAIIIYSPRLERRTVNIFRAKKYICIFQIGFGSRNGPYFFQIFGRSANLYRGLPRSQRGINQSDIEIRSLGHSETGAFLKKYRLVFL